MATCTSRVSTASGAACTVGWCAGAGAAAPAAVCDLRRCADPWYLPPPWQLSLTHQLQGELHDLFDLRNTFLHFSEDGWTLDLAEAPPLVRAACSVIRHLSVTQPAYLSRAERGHRERVRAGLETIETAMEHFADSAA